MHRSSAFHVVVPFVFVLAVAWLWCIRAFDLPVLEQVAMVGGIAAMAAIVGAFVGFWILYARITELESLSRSGILSLLGRLTVGAGVILFVLQWQVAGLAWIGMVATAIGAFVIPAVGGVLVSFRRSS